MVGRVTGRDLRKEEGGPREGMDWRRKYYCDYLRILLEGEGEGINPCVAGPRSTRLDLESGGWTTGGYSSVRQ